MTKFKAAILVEQNKPLVVDEIELPKLKFGQVLVKIHRSTICGAQIGEIEGVKGSDKFLPHLLGHEAGGVVLETGEGVKTLKQDDHVAAHWRKGKGIESETPKYKWGMNKFVNAGWVTTFNELSVISENRLTKIDTNVSYENASLVGCAITTAFGLINNDAKLKIGESVMIIGCGSVGLSSILGASLVSANPIIAVDIYDNKLELAKSFGATHTINSSNGSIVEQLQNHLGEKEIDVVIETTGSVNMIENSYILARKRSGRAILVGVPHFKKNINIHSLPLHFGKILRGTEGGSTKPNTDIPKYLKLCKDKKIDITRLISKHYDLIEINDAINDIKSGKEIKCCVDF